MRKYYVNLDILSHPRMKRDFTEASPHIFTFPY